MNPMFAMLNGIEVVAVLAIGAMILFAGAWMVGKIVKR
jgi:hypothetical protein